jgi:hypothetical protein
MNSNTFKLLWVTAFISIFMVMPHKKASAQVAACSFAGGKIQTPVTNGACYAPATTMNFPVTKIMLCHKRLTAPTTTVPIDTSGCALLYSSASSQDVPVNLGTVQFPGIVSSQATLLQGNPPSKGNQFTYAYIESLPYAIVNAKATFDSSQTAVDGTSGATCWTTGNQIYNYNNSTPTNIASCGSAASANPSGTKVWLNSLGTGSAYMSYSDVENGLTVDTYLVDSANRQAVATTPGSMGTVAKIINVQQINYNFTMESKGINARVNISQAAWFNTGPVYIINGNATLSLTGRN